MPNWCSNSLTVSHKDAAKIKEFVEAAAADELFTRMVPLSSGEWAYDVAVNEWGTKWDATDADITASDDGLSASGFFMSAWAPPVEAYRKLTELGFDIDATYHEPGMAFAGRYTSEGDEVSYEYDFGDADWRDGIDDEVVLDMLESEYESWLEWQEQDEDHTEEAN